MNIQALTIGLKVKHPQYGIGVIKSIAERTAEIRFDDATRTVDPELSGVVPAEAAASITGLTLPFDQLVQNTVEAVMDRLGYEDPSAVVKQLGVRWQGGKIVMHPADPLLQTKEVPLEIFFHKIVGLRNQLRVLEQKVNAHPTLTDGEKVEMQQYITRCYGSMTTFNILFRNKEDQFSSKAE
jgi:hypothetical protein